MNFKMARLEPMKDSLLPTASSVQAATLVASTRLQAFLLVQDLSVRLTLS